MNIEVIKNEFCNIIDSTQEVKQLASGFEFTEGPIWHPIKNILTFSDMPGDIRRTWDEVKGVKTVISPANKCNGMTYDHELNLIVCEHSTSSLYKEDSDGNRECLASHFEGKELNSPNDVCVHSSGAIFFTDPWYGRMPVFGIERERELGFQGLYKISPNQKGCELVADKFLFEQPNGLCFSPDETLLYVNDTEKGLIRVFDVDKNANLTNQRIFFDGILSNEEPGAPDGMKCDALGNIWVTAPGGIWVINQYAELIGKIAVPELVGNITWGGDDWRTLFIAASNSIYSVKTLIGPHVEPYMKQDKDKFINSKSCALIIQDLQNDVVSLGGKFASDESLEHFNSQHVISNLLNLIEKAKSFGIPIIHIKFTVDSLGKELPNSAKLFNDIIESGAVQRGSWGSDFIEPLKGSESFVIEKSHMSAWEGTNLESILKANKIDTIINTGSWTNMSVEHTARTGADKGYKIFIPEDCCSSLNDKWHKSALEMALPNVSTIVKTQDLLSSLY